MRWKIITGLALAGGIAAGMATLAKVDNSGIGAVALNAANQLVTPSKPVLEGEPATAVEVNGRELPMRMWFQTAMPGEVLNIALPSGFVMRIGGRLVHRKGNVNFWEAPEDPGVTEIAFMQPNGKMAHKLTVFTLEPASSIRNGRLNGYRIGTYPANAPQGYIRLNGPEDLKTPVSQHFRIGQFICKQQPDHWPKYVLLTPSLLTRLEAVLTELNQSGRTNARTLFVMSGYRTPFYNTAIRGAKRSRHMYGDAADVYVDANPTDGVMDDLTGDGKINKRDANFLFDFASDTFQGLNIPKGGIGAYKANAVHGPFVHIDGRGKQARWGR